MTVLGVTNRTKTNIQGTNSSTPACFSLPIFTPCMHACASSYYLQYWCFTFTHHATSHIFGGLLCRTWLQRFDSNEDQLAVNMRRSCFFHGCFQSCRKGWRLFPLYEKQCALNFRADQIPVLWRKSTHLQLIKLPSNNWYAMNLGALGHLRGPGPQAVLDWLVRKWESDETRLSRVRLFLLSYVWVINVVARTRPLAHMNTTYYTHNNTYFN